MIKRILPIILLTLLGCTDPQGIQTQRELSQPTFFGKWETPGCTQTSASQGKATKRWAKSHYEFDPQGLIKYSIKIYADAACSEEIRSMHNRNRIDLKFDVLAIRGTSDGKQAHTVRVTSIDKYDNQRSFEGFFMVIENRRLCTSKRIVFEADGFTLSDDGAGFQDYRICLQRTDD